MTKDLCWCFRDVAGGECDVGHKINVLTIEQNIHRKTTVFACFLDAGKAFDLVNHDLLFNLLLDRGLPYAF